MSLASQSQQWYPTSVQVTVFQARNLRIKGKNGTNDAYAIIQVAKDKFSTSVVEKCVSPVWKEEATFDLPLFHRGNADRCTLYIIVMHRALVGLDKLLGQAVINLLELHENKSRNKTEWFKLVDKNGKADKDRGEVLLDIQFMRNNITASMFDLSMQEKPRSHIGKLKDKIRGKKSGFSDSASAIVPSVSQVMTDSEEDGDAHAEPSGPKKKSKIKSLFGPKSNLQRNVSQSMSTLGTLPEQNSALSGSRSSGLNIDSPEAKKKFKFLTHKRTDSSDSRTSLGPFSLLNRSKQNVVEQSGVCINGSHVYTEETEPKSSTLSLPNSNQGSAEDVRPVLGRNPSDVSVDSLKGLSLPSYRAESRQKTQLEEDRQQAERVQEERAQLEEQQRRREEQDKRKVEEERRKVEEQQQKKKQEEEERRKQEEVRRAEERRRQEDEKKSVEASNREEPTVTDRLSSLFGIGRKKEEHPAASQEEKHGVEDPPPPGSTNRFEEIPLSPEPPNPFGESSQQASQSLQTSTGFPNRTAKVFPVKPRFVAESIQGTPPSPSADPYIESHLPSSSTPNSTNPTLPSESSDMFSTLHSSLAPPNARRGSSDSLGSINEILDSESHGTSTSQKWQAPLPAGEKASAKHEVSPSVYSDRSQSIEAGKPKAAPRSLSSKTAATSGYLNPIAEVSDCKEKESSAFQSDKRPPLPFPDYDELFPKRRHGIQGQVKWDKVISEVNLKQKKNRADIDQNEMSVDGPDLNSGSRQVQDERTDIFSRMTENQDQEEPFPVWKRTSITNKRPVVPPKPKLVTLSPAEISKKSGSMTEKPNRFASRVFLTATPKVQNTDAPQAKSHILLDYETKVQNTDAGKGKDNSPKDLQNSTTVVNKDVVSQSDTKTPFKSSKDSPPVKPRQSSLNKAPNRNASNQEAIGSVVIQKPQNEAKDTKVLEKVSGTEEINEVFMTTNNADLFSDSIFLKIPTVTQPDFEEKAIQSPAKQLVFEPDPFPNNSFLSKDLVVGKSAESQGDTQTPVKSTNDSPLVKPRQSSLKAPIRTIPVQEKLGPMVNQKPQDEAKDTPMLEEVPGSAEVNEVFMTTNNADLFSGSIFLKTPTVTKPDFEEKAVQSPAKQLVFEPDPFPNNSFLSKDLVVDKSAESQGDTQTPVKSIKQSPSIKPRQGPLNKAPIGNSPDHEKLGPMVTQKPQDDAKDTPMLEEVPGSEEVNEVFMTTNNADLFSGSTFLKTLTVTKPDFKEKAVENSPVKEQVVELDSSPNDLFLSKDPVLVKDAESQGAAKTPFKSTNDSPLVKPRQSSLKAPIRTIPVQEKLGPMVNQKPQDEAKDTPMLEEVPGSAEVNEVFMTTNNADLFSGSIFLKTPTVTKPDFEEKAVQSPAKQLVVEPDPFPNNSFLSKDLVVDKSAESQGGCKTLFKTTRESPSIKPRQSSLKAPIGTVPVQEKLCSMVTQKPQNEAKHSQILEKVSGNEEINEEFATMTKGTDLFSDDTLVFTNMLKAGCEEKAEESPAKWQIVEPDPFPNDIFLSKDPWALPLESKNKSEQIMSEEDLEKIFSSNIVDPFTGVVHNESAKFPEPNIETTGKTNAEPSSGAQSHSFTKKKAPPVPVNAANVDKITTTAHLFKHKHKVTMSTGEPKMETRIQNLDSPAKRESAVFQSKKTLVAADPIPSASSPVFSSLTSPEPQMSATEEGTAQHGVTSGGKTLLRAWVTPSESQSVSVQNSSGGGAIGKMGEPASSLRRPHPVKPLGSESLISTSTLQGQDSRPTETHEPILRKAKVTTSESGPYSQLTQEELITLVVKQQAEISKKDAKILELEEYIDNLLVRVIDEKPSILMSMPTSKKAF